MNSIKSKIEIYYKKFSKAKGNHHIAGHFALKTILNLIKFNKSNAILEVGLGIGSIAYSITDFLKNSNKTFKYIGTENNEFCLEELPKNLGDNFVDIKIYDSLENIPKDLKFDFIIVDGSDSNLEKIVNLVHENAVIFIEGGRIKQVGFLKRVFPKNLYTSVISDYKNPSYGPFSSDKWSGGGQLIFINPTIRQFMLFLKYRVSTSFKYKISRKIKNRL